MTHNPRGSLIAVPEYQMYPCLSSNGGLETDFSNFDNSLNYSKNRTNAIKTSFCTFLTIAEESVYYPTIWHRFGTNLAQEKEGSDCEITPLVLSKAIPVQCEYSNIDRSIRIYTIVYVSKD